VLAAVLGAAVFAPLVALGASLPRFEKLPSANGAGGLLTLDDEPIAYPSLEAARRDACAVALEADGCKAVRLFDLEGIGYFAIVHRNRYGDRTADAIDIVVTEGPRGRASAAFHAELFSSESGSIGPAQAVDSPAGRLIVVPVSLSGTAAFIADLFFVRRGGIWRQVDTESWKDSVKRPPCERIWKGVRIEPSDFTVRFPVWSRGDEGACTPSSGEVRARLRLEGRRLFIEEQAYRPDDRRAPDSGPGAPHGN